MAFELQTKESIVAGIKRAIEQQTKAAQSELDELDADQTPHELRKRFKRIRALTRLVREPLGEKAYRAANTVVRDAGKPLAPIRDAQVLVTALDKLANRHSHVISRANLKPVKVALEANYNAARVRVLGSEAERDQIVENIEAIRKNITRWKIRARGWQAISPGLQRTYRLAQEAYRCSTLDPAIDLLHEWRKQSKYLWNQLQFLAPLRPRLLNAIAKSIRKLTDLLGDDHDLAILGRTFVVHAEEWGMLELEERMLMVIRKRRAELQEKSITLGKLIYRRSPEDFVRKLRGGAATAG